MGKNDKSPGCMKIVGLKKGPWSPEEDQKLLDYIHKHGFGGWRVLPSKAGLRRCGKSCRLRWRNYLRPDIKRGEFSLQEEQTIIQLHALLGNRWSIIANQLPRRTDNEIKNHWNTHLKKRLTKMGIDPVTHKRSNQSREAANISHLAQWETARLEAEVRLASNPSPPPPCPQQQGAYPYPWTWTSSINPNNDDFVNTTSDPLIISAGSSSDSIDGFGSVPQINLLYSSCFGSNYNSTGDGNVAGSYSLEFPGEFSSSSSSWTSNYAEQQSMEGPASVLKCPNGIMY